jgi:hypothetical protein
MRTRKLDAYNEQIKDAYLHGNGLILIAQVYGVSTGTIRNILIRLNVPLRKPGRPQEKRDAI